MSKTFNSHLSTRSFDTDTYRFNHGHRPRGTGFWFFEVTYWNGSKIQHCYHGSYTSAKQQLLHTLRYGTIARATRITVLP